MAGARTFDHDEAKRLKAEGYKTSEIAAMLGVSTGAIQWATQEGIMANWARVHYRIPPDLKRALERYALAEGRSVNSQVIKIFQDVLDWRWYEETEDTEVIFAHPMARHIRRPKSHHSRRPT